MFSIFRKKKQPKEVLGFYARTSQVSPAYWRASKPLVTIANKFLNDPEFQTMLDVLKNSLYQRYKVSVCNDGTELAFLQCRLEGFATCLDTLESLGRYEPIVPPEEETFEPPEPPNINTTQTIESE